MNLMSSMAKTLVGSPIAIVSVAPVLFTGSTPYFRATSPGTILMTKGSISKCDRSIDGTPNCCESISVMSFSETAPMRTSASPSFPPSSRCDFRDASTCSCVTSFALRSKSPSFTAMGNADRKVLPGGVSKDVQRQKKPVRRIPGPWAVGPGLVFLHRLQLPDQVAHLQFRAQLDGDLAGVVGQPED